MNFKKVFWMSILLLLGGFFMSRAFLNGEVTLGKKNSQMPKRILLLGASVGKEWNLSGWPVRMKNGSYIFETVTAYSFDKSDALNEILIRPKRKFRLTRSYIKGLFKEVLNKPEVIIIKECAAYFPGDLRKYKLLVKEWVVQCKAVGIKPVLATVVPVTVDHSHRKLGRLQGILEYNDWIKEYTSEIDIDFLDLEASLRINEKDRALRPDLTSGDGLHLNKKAYGILDDVLAQKLLTIFR